VPLRLVGGPRTRRNGRHARNVVRSTIAQRWRRRRWTDDGAGGTDESFGITSARQPLPGTTNGNIKRYNDDDNNDNNYYYRRSAAGRAIFSATIRDPVVTVGWRGGICLIPEPSFLPSASTRAHARTQHARTKAAARLIGTITTIIIPRGRFPGVGGRTTF